ncbi:MAG TPA: 50S ribosomal protein L29 [Bacteroidota bacterium]|uniref:Large ribosomal subunit protein uL29 n=1 Tax=uncultured Ignavibacteria bacterium Rifle_16ft_4_minimus_38087 TaxID=1665104 RepID=A0A0H4T9S0_9BACT|nr:50S ribosomal protein L29, large subunit ribosomal protein L29 [uncultured Ignavibacteria bacterium Rifle_16ft_4_minimus_38087]HLE33745.1 50S ribosomal protein L29 [Bacteroidota bacterium]
MKAHELRQLSDEELKKRIQDEEENLANLRFQKALSQVENPMKFRHSRRDIARMKTVLRERTLTPKSTPARESAPKANS